MFRKKILTLSVLLLTVVLFATSCEVHEHVYNEDWKCNAFEHWQVCPEDGVKLERSKHVLDEDNKCTICGCLALELDDAIYIHCYDEYDNITRLASYDLDGSFLSETIYKNEYDENEDLVKVTTIMDGFVAEIEEFSTNEYGDPILRKDTRYISNGDYSICEYNEEGDIISRVSYNADDTVYEGRYYEYSPLPEEGTYLSKVTVESSDRTQITTYNEYEDIVSIVIYDKDNNKIYDAYMEYTYFENGTVKLSKLYLDGILTKEEEYEVEEKYDEDGMYSVEHYLVIRTTYDEDGEKTVETYSKNGDLISEIKYDKDNNEIENLYWEYIYDENGNLKCDRFYVNGFLSEENEYAVIYYEDGNFDSYLAVNTYYYEDGDKYVTEYNEDGQEIREITYDKDGNIISEKTWENTYDENGYIINRKQYENGVLREERGYAVYMTDDLTDYYLEFRIYYDTNGDKYVTEYDRHDNEIKDACYDADGNAVYEYIYEYVYYEGSFEYENLKMYYNGELVYEEEYASYEKEVGYEQYTVHYLEKEISYYDGIKNVIEYDKDGNEIREIDYDAENNKINETFFDEDGYETIIKEYENGVLVSEREFETEVEYFENGYAAYTYPVRITNYNEDGTKTVAEYNRNFVKLSEITYDKDGNKMYEDTFEYIHETFIIDGEEEERTVCEKTYRDGVLYKETSYDFENFIVTMTVYNEDGTKTISRYDIWGELIDKETVAQ